MTTTNDKKRKFDKKLYNFFLVIFFTPDSKLNFIIKLRQTTYLETGVTAVKVKISKFLTFLTRSFFQAKNTNTIFSVKNYHLVSLLPYTND